MTKSENRNTSADESFWYNDAESMVREEPAKPRAYDLEERTARFGEAVIDFVRQIPQDAVTSRLISQLVGAATSVGANYVEADDAVSKKEFLKSIGTCRKEARETKHFLRMIVRAVPELKPQARTLWLEAKEVNLTFSKIGEANKSTGMMRRPNHCVSKHFVIRASSFLRASAFGFRHFQSFPPCPLTLL